jgi:hypothetical protein
MTQAVTALIKRFKTLEVYVGTLNAAPRTDTTEELHRYALFKSNDVTYHPTKSGLGVSVSQGLVEESFRLTVHAGHIIGLRSVAMLEYPNPTDWDQPFEIAYPGEEFDIKYDPDHADTHAQINVYIYAVGVLGDPLLAQAKWVYEDDPSPTLGAMLLGSMLVYNDSTDSSIRLVSAKFKRAYAQSATERRVMRHTLGSYIWINPARFGEALATGPTFTGGTVLDEGGQLTMIESTQVPKYMTGDVWRGGLRLHPDLFINFEELLNAVVGNPKKFVSWATGEEQTTPFAHLKLSVWINITGVGPTCILTRSNLSYANINDVISEGVPNEMFPSALTDTCIFWGYMVINTNTVPNAVEGVDIWYLPRAM